MKSTSMLISLPPRLFAQLLARRSDRLSALLGTLLLLLTPCGVAQAAGSGLKGFSSSANLLEVELRNVAVQADSLTDAWQAICRQALMQALLVRPETEPQSPPFLFRAEVCTVGDLLRAFTNAYSGYSYTHDTSSGVLWLHPVQIPYGQILDSRVSVTTGATALPMLDGILHNLVRIKALGVREGGRRNSATLNGFNYAVDLPEGVHSVREILNFCCTMNPADTFCVSKSPRGFWEITPVNIGYRDIGEPAPCAVFFWQRNLGPTKGAFPHEKEVMAALSDPDLRRREVARGYLELNQSDSTFQKLFASVETPTEAVWTAVGVLAVMVRMDEATYPPAIQTLNRALNGSPSGVLAPGLEALAAVAIAGASSTNLTALERMAKHSLSKDDLASVKYDIIRILRYSGRVRQKLKDLSPDWAGFSTTDIEALSLTNFFNLP